jgi:hypothetical protein
MGYTVYNDQQEVKISVKDLTVVDNSSYPRTLDPSKTYQPEDQIMEEEIIGLNKESR